MLLFFMPIPYAPNEWGSDETGIRTITETDETMFLRINTGGTKCSNRAQREFISP